MSAKKVEGSSAPAVRRGPYLYEILSGTHLDQKYPNITYSDVDGDFGFLLMADLQRSIPSMVDGLIPGQRKILFTAFKTNLVEEITVSEFCGDVAAHSAYYDGEQKLASTIIGMAQDYVGSNNINLLVPAGQFGTRYSGGIDAASARYSNTRLSPITRVLFPKDDDVLLNYLNEDGLILEPTWYMPIIPTVLVNGSEAIGTECTTFIPNYNPREIVANIRRLLNGERMVPMDPWYRGFKGTIEKTASKEVGCTYTVSGLYEEVNDTCIRITELPIKKWTRDYKKFVTSLPLLQDKINNSDNISVDFYLILSEENMAVARKKGFLKTFKLTTTISTSNMYLFDKENVFKKYATPEQILEEFFVLRLEYYELRKKIRLQNLKLELLKLYDKVRFILEFQSGKSLVNCEDKAELVQRFREQGFTPLPKNATPVEAAVAGAIDDAAEESSMAPEPSSTAFVPGSEYDYLLECNFTFFTYEKSQELLAEINKMNEVVAELEKATPRSLWQRDLDALDKELVKLDEAEEERKAKWAKAGATKGRKQLAKKAVTKKAFEPESSNSAMDTDNIVAEVVKPKGRQPAKKKSKVISGTHLDQKDPKIMYSNFMADLQRSIPSMVDGLIPGQRKILFTAFKTNLVEEITVSKFCGDVAAHSAYYDGEQRLASTIIGMAQDFVGSNNINLLVPAGQFGTRYSGGIDAASARYSNTRLSPITRVLFPKDDDVLLNYLNEDALIIEPTWYMPIIPTVLVNGSKGIGTGCSTTFIPNYNPREIVANIRRLLNGERMVPMDPWYRGFKGTIEKTASKEVGCTYTVTGLYEEVNDTCIRITELPIRKWTGDYKKFVTSLPLLQDHINYNHIISVRFDLILSEENMAVARKKGFLETFKLTTTISTSNMHLFDKEGVLKKYATPEQILEEFFELRLEYYELRKKIRLPNLKLELLKLDNKVRFIGEVLSGEIIVINTNKAELVQRFREKGFTPLPKKATPVEAPVAGAIDDAAEESSMAPEPSSTAFVPGSEYDYLLECNLTFFTYEKSQELLAEINKMNEAVAELEKATPRSLWQRDLDALDKELDKLDEAEEERKAIWATAGATKGRKQPAKKAVTKKAIEPESSNSAMETDDDDDVFAVLGDSESGSANDSEFGDIEDDEDDVE